MKVRDKEKFRPIHVIRRDNLIRVFNAWKELGTDRNWKTFSAEIGINRTLVSLMANKKERISGDRADQFEEFFGLDFGYMDIEKKNTNPLIDVKLMGKISDVLISILDDEKLILDSKDFEYICNEAYEIFKATGSVSPARLTKLLRGYVNS